MITIIKVAYLIIHEFHHGVNDGVRLLSRRDGDEVKRLSGEVNYLSVACPDDFNVVAGVIDY